ncbi:polyribonucleotide nucleotidyltransferase [Helicobacter monodelphidis]|uniref:polyribonucleotide nucleotidyltransferase n=1 Tax=Helicobacter sp. 15-1451 TaxID=2004995 RepID=UPI000DCE6EF3|nr:polyribonucleotide nucleotidyltransferase [Helicobacter sp. 15-1451]RAX58827.1 polyribonucleotide nucleotidyltransferase [Helicobacter sp. 15-1451]
MKVTIESTRKIEYFTLNKVAKQANGSVLLQVGDSVALATICSDFAATNDSDFLPLTVQYIEKSYAAGKIPGGFIKREAKPSDFETLSARIVDRTLRPLFPKGYHYPTQITILILSCDGVADLQTLALNVASCALYLSDIPVRQPAVAVRIGRINKEFILNPTLEEMNKSTLDLFVSGVHHDLLMIEMRCLSKKSTDSQVIGGACATLSAEVIENLTQHCANELNEEELLQALDLAMQEIAAMSQKYEDAFQSLAKPNAVINLKAESYSDEIYQYLKEKVGDEVKIGLQQMAKSERTSILADILKKVLQDEEIQNRGFDVELVELMLHQLKRDSVRKMILQEHKRPDGRGLCDVRPIQIECNILPKAHSSALFTRGQTQALVIATLGGDSDAQSYELLSDKGNKKEKFMMHYNFPPFSVGEVGVIGSPGRRELGHGNLAKRALEPVIEDLDTQTIRLVSEILESNGSSSMASVCGGSLALAAAGVGTTDFVAGVAMGLIMEGDKYAILTDIMGLEDHDGDMDFKVAGTHKGITAMQMDIKLGGLSMQILKEALIQAKEGREHILNIMKEASKEIVVNEDNLPSLQIFSIQPSRIVDVIGQAGKTIREIIEKFEVAIDLNRENGEVKVSGESKEKVLCAKDFILNIANQEDGHIQKIRIGDLYQVGEKYEGKVKKVVEFGAFIELPKGGDGLLHVSRIVSNRSAEIRSVLQEGDKLEVEILSVNKNRVELGFLRKI